MTLVQPGRVGPNAITRMAEALSAFGGPDAARRVFAQAGLLPYLSAPPRSMVDENEVRRLHQALREKLSAPEAEAVARDAGHRTADYLIAHRIPKAFQWLLRQLPAVLAARLLLRAIRRHAWTFVGSGRFELRSGVPISFVIVDNPLCRGVRADAPACAFHSACFERLFRRLVRLQARVTERACEARGDAACVFELGLPR